VSLNQDMIPPKKVHMKNMGLKCSGK
jgi:hypothetical protein